MSPRGFYQRESISPYFTSDLYKSSDHYKDDIATMDRLEKKAEAIFKYPGKLAKKVWKKLMVWLGYLDQVDKSTYL